MSNISLYFKISPIFSPQVELEALKIKRRLAPRLLYIRLGRTKIMIRAAIGFFILGLLAIMLGASNVAGLSIEVGKTLLFVFLALAVLSALVGLVSGRSPKILP